MTRSTLRREIVVAVVPGGPVGALHADRARSARGCRPVRSL
jgi:hypothetical protein